MPSAGRVGRPHGLDGHFHVTQPMPALLSVGTPVRIGDVDTVIVARKGPDDAPILRVEGAADRSAAVAFRGQELIVERTVAPDLEEDEYWAEDLVGCSVLASEKQLGVVSALLGLPSCEALELDTGVIVPLVHDAIRSIDVEARRIEVDGEFLGAA